jgi:YidC/Oxa1 family membrane protein insertase
MLSEGFDDAVVDPTEVKETDMAAALQIIDAATDRLKVEDRVLVGEDYSTMTPADVSTVIGALQEHVDLDAEKGFWATILGWIGVFLGWIDGLTGSYLVALIIFAILVEILMLPLSIRQQKNSIKQAKLRPKEMAIRKKYAGRDDQKTRQRVQEEIQSLYQRENFNPASGCLPLLLQLPIVLALYRIVIDPLQYVLGQSASLSASLEIYRTAARAAGGLGEAAAANSGTIGLLSKIGSNLDGLKNFMFFDNAGEVFDRMSGLTIPDFSMFGLNLGLTPSLKGNPILLIVPVLTFVAYYFTMKLTKKFTYQPTSADPNVDQQTACSNKIMDLMMPIMSTYICFIVPAMVGVYWIFKSLITTLRQYIVAKIMPLPQFTEEDYKAAEREYAGKAPKKDAPSQRGAYTYPTGTKTVGGKPRSLFHMDDDDYVARMEEEAKKEEEEGEKQPQNQAGASKLDLSAKLKRDDKDNQKDGE